MMTTVKPFAKYLAIACSFLTLGLLFSCKKTLNPGNDIIELPVDFSKKVTASVNGFVTNEDKAPVAGANVKYGTSNSTTDQYGYFEINNASVTENAGVVTVEMPGYFPGIKTFISEAGKKNFCRIKLLPKTNSGTVEAATGGDVTLSNGLKVTLPATGIIDAATKAPYSGTVHVSSHWINPLAVDLNEIMPGDLRGINTNGLVRSLKSFGMAAVELIGNAGQLLQIAEGKKAILTFPIPTTISAEAPASIPLWYFDETKGLWIEEGNAIKSGNNYVGDVAHFSFWNCDVPGNFVLFDCKIVTESGRPVANQLVKVFDAANNTSGFATTNDSGYVSGFVPVNAQLELQLIDPEMPCSLLFSQPFVTAFQSISLGNIILPNSMSNLAGISGNIIDCNGAPVSQGYIVMFKNNQYSTHPISSNGTFSFETFICSGTSPQINLVVIDTLSGRQSSVLPFNLSPGNNTFNDLPACQLSTATFITNIIDGFTYEYASPDSLYIRNHDTVFYANGNDESYSPNRFVGFTFIGGRSMGVGSSQRLLDFVSSNIHERVYYNTGMLINITEHGNVGEFIAGNFSGVLRGVNTQHDYQIQCRFRLRRQP